MANVDGKTNFFQHTSKNRRGNFLFLTNAPLNYTNTERFRIDARVELSTHPHGALLHRHHRTPPPRLEKRQNSGAVGPLYSMADL